MTTHEKAYQEYVARLRGWGYWLKLYRGFDPRSTAAVPPPHA